MAAELESTPPGREPERDLTATWNRRAQTAILGR